MKRCGPLVDALRKESQGNILVLEDRGKPVSDVVWFIVSVSKESRVIVSSTYVINDVRAST
jgi:hypothetical protein